MSKETLQWLNTHTLIGQTDVRGNAWHYRMSEQGTESNHYPGFIPVADVSRRLLNWEVRETPVYVEVPADVADMTTLDKNGMPVRKITVPGKALYASDNGHVFKIFSDSYEVHQYQEWLVDNVAAILGEDLGISSAGLLADRGICWVEVSTPENLTAHGFEFRPNLVACTSHTGKLATTYKRTIGATVCDNTLTAALAEGGETFKRKHTKGSLNAVKAREALGMVLAMGDATTARISELVNTKISGLQMKTIIGQLVPDTDKSPSAVATRDRKVGELLNLWTADKRVAPWKGTAFGVVQLFNTWQHHYSRTHTGTDRGQRNTLDALTGATDKRDAEVLRVLAGV